VETILECNQVRFSRRMTNQLDRRLHGLGATHDEEESVEVWRQDLMQPIG
jgi:hypothetical protein